MHVGKGSICEKITQCPQVQYIPGSTLDISFGPFIFLTLTKELPELVIFLFGSMFRFLFNICELNG